MGTERITWEAANARRSARHGLTTPWREGTGVGTVASVICGAHAQIASAGEVSLALRIDGATRSDVQRALWTDHELVRTFGPRGTVHLLAAADLPAWTGALGAIPRPWTGVPDEQRYSETQTDELVAAIGQVLAEAELTTDELTTALVDTVGSWAAEPPTDAFQQVIPRWRLLTHVAAHRGVLCFGPNRGRRVTYTHPRRYVPGFVPAAADVGLAAIVVAYLEAYGPATPQQFARWFGAPIPSATAGFASLEGRIEQVEFDGSPAWVVAGDTGGEAPPPPPVRLLPYFDAFGVGSYPRDRLFPGRAWDRALAGGQAGNYPLVLLDGVVGGVWHQRRAGRRLRVTVEPLEPLTPGQRRHLDDEVARVAAVQDASPDLTVGAVTVGAHA